MPTSSTIEMFKNQDLRTGGFFELCIQVSESSKNDIVQKYFDFFWNQPNVEGPFDNDLKPINKIIDYRLEGILNIENVKIPFINFNIKEENPIETGSYWFDISFYITTIEKLFQIEPQNWDEKSNCPKELLEYLLQLMKKLYEIHPFKLALLDFEISGEYRIEDLKNLDFVNWSNSILYIGKENLDKVNEENLKYVKILNE
ncbi:hypothetical protein OBK29_15060 [Empedobacter falsenii]|uniref:hypothetical protein n=2 Tax=Weeksellaceae TaxID=2762318 RepID=UPI0025C06A35|nr:hypothetical protein [Empedobacter sp. UBA3239]